MHAGFARESNESVALKVINKDGVMTLPDMIGVEQEIRALKCLSQHPNIVRLVEVVNAPAHIILITPYVSRYEGQQGGAAGGTLWSIDLYLHAAPLRTSRAGIRGLMLVC